MNVSTLPDPSLPPRMRRLLFVSRHYASDFSQKVGGIFQRMRMLLDAAAASSDAIDILFFVDQRMIDEIGPLPAQASLEAHWGLTTCVHLAPRGAMQHGPLMQTLRALIDFRAQDDYFRLNGTAQFAAVRSHVMADTDLVVAHRLYVGSTVVGAGVAPVPIVMDLDDIEHRNRARQFARSMGVRNSRTGRFELKALKRGELATLRACRTSFVCSSIDRDYLATEGVTNTTVIPNAMRFPEPAVPVPTEPATLFFIGTYGYPPNADAAEFLIGTVFPLVRAVRPEAILLIVGESFEKLPSYARQPPHVEFAGFVPDLAEVYRRATVVCCPILAGGGTRIKIIEAAAAGKAIVSTTVGAEGLALVDGTEILLRDTPEAFADACVALIDDAPRVAALGAAAFLKARSLYERSHVVDRIARAFGENVGTDA